jgi:hypothetical protein
MSLPGRRGPEAAIACEPPSRAGSINELPIWKRSLRVAPRSEVGAGRFLDMIPKFTEKFRSRGASSWDERRGGFLYRERKVGHPSAIGGTLGRGNRRYVAAELERGRFFEGRRFTGSSMEYSAPTLV